MVSVQQHVVVLASSRGVQHGHWEGSPVVYLSLRMMTLTTYSCLLSMHHHSLIVVAANSSGSVAPCRPRSAYNDTSHLLLASFTLFLAVLLSLLSLNCLLCPALPCPELTAAAGAAPKAVKQLQWQPQHQQQQPQHVFHDPQQQQRHQSQLPPQLQLQQQMLAGPPPPAAPPALPQGPFSTGECIDRAGGFTSQCDFVLAPSC